MAFDGPTAEAIGRYSQIAVSGALAATSGRGSHTAILDVPVIDAAGAPVVHYTPGSPLRARSSSRPTAPRVCRSKCFSSIRCTRSWRWRRSTSSRLSTLPEQAGRYRLTLEVQPGWLASGNYSLDVTTSVVNSSWDHYVDNAAAIEVIACNPGGLRGTSSTTTAMARSRCRAWPPEFCARPRRWVSDASAGDGVSGL